MTPAYVRAFAVASLKRLLPAAVALGIAAPVALADGNAPFRTAQLFGSSKPAAPTLYAYAKASPLMVSDSASLQNPHKQDFEFGKAYETLEQTGDYVKLKLADGTQVYARPAHVTTVRAPRFVTTTSGYNRAERPRLRMWESTVRLNEFLSGVNTAGSPWDYEEYFETPPDFQLKLPIIETDTLDLLGGDRQVKVVSVLLPIARSTVEAFEAAKASPERMMSLHVLADVSGTTRDFLEPVMASLVKGMNRSDEIKKRFDTISVTTFGSGRRDKAAYLGTLSLTSLDEVVWHKKGEDLTNRGEREPLVDGVVAMNSGFQQARSKLPLLLILSGADVETSSTTVNPGRSTALDSVDLPADAGALVAQITPEPGDSLRTASGKLKNLSRVRYLEYSDSLADDILQGLLRSGDGVKTAAIPIENFAPAAKAAHAARMMAFLPRNLTPTASLPSRQAYAAQADWYTVRLWLTLDELLLTETAQ